MTMLLRIIISENEIRRLSIENIPPSVEKLYALLQTKLGLRRAFVLQFEDPEFNFQLCNLSDIKDLPEERVTLKVVFKTDSVLPDSVAVPNTSSLPSCSEDSLEWPDPFVIPQFSYDVEAQLREANCRYVKDGTVSFKESEDKCS